MKKGREKKETKKKSLEVWIVPEPSMSQLGEHKGLVETVWLCLQKFNLNSPFYTHARTGNVHVCELSFCPSTLSLHTQRAAKYTYIQKKQENSRGANRWDSVRNRAAAEWSWLRAGVLDCRGRDRCASLKPDHRQRDRQSWKRNCGILIVIHILAVQLQARQEANYDHSPPMKLFNLVYFTERNLFIIDLGVI